MRITFQISKFILYYLLTNFTNNVNNLLFKQKKREAKYLPNPTMKHTKKIIFLLLLLLFLILYSLLTIPNLYCQVYRHRFQNIKV